MSATKNSRVVIAGAGPAGASLAWLLASRGIPVALLERHSDFAREFRGEAIMPSGIEAIRAMGLGTAFDDVPHVEVGSIEIRDRDRPLFRFDLRSVGLGVLPRIVSQPLLLEMFVEQAGRHPRFALHRGVRAVDLVYDGDRVAGVEATAGRQRRTYRADVVVGADGRMSTLRRVSGLHERRTPQNFDVVWCKIPPPSVPRTGPATVQFFLGRGHMAVSFPACDGLLQIGWVIQKGAYGALRDRGVREWAQEMSAHMGARLGRHIRECVDELRHPFLLDVVCDRLVRWSRPGLLLLGDAAHPMSPVGAQGVNIALRDAIVAANHLCPALESGRSGRELSRKLDEAAEAFEAERMKEVRAVQRIQQAPPALLLGSSWGKTFTRRLVFLLLRSGLAAPVYRRGVRRLATGVTEVALHV